MHKFIARHEDQILGVLAGFDRLIFRGTLRPLAYPDGMMRYLWAKQVLLKAFDAHVKDVTERLKAAIVADATRRGRPVQYLASSDLDKEALARQIAAADQVREGLIAVLTCVEPCWSFEVHRDRTTKRLELRAAPRKCLFLYQYWMHPRWGFMHARIQSWFPFPIQVALNGREWLARQLDAAGIRYVRHDNCFPWIADWARAQQLMARQLRTAWTPALNRIAAVLNPVHGAIFRHWPVHYYWSTYQSEWAIDITFRDATYLQRLVPRLMHHAITTFGSPDALRFLGRRVPVSGDVPVRFNGDVVSNLKHRAEGMRVKHTVNGNSVKLYDKAFTPYGSVLRAETTINNGADFRVYRAKEGDPDGPRTWRVLRRGIADLHRRADVSGKAAERYLDALAAADDDTTLEELLLRVGHATTWHGRRVRALQPFTDDRALIQAISRGEFTLSGLRNRDLQRLLFHAPPPDPAEARRRSAWVTRRLRLLRAHHLLQKIPGTHRYHLTTAGRRITTAVLTALRCTLRQLTPVAA